MKKQKSNLRILLVVPYTKPDYSGSGINAFNFARFLNREGFTATVLTFNRNLRLKTRETIENVPIHRIAYFNRNLALKILSLPVIIPAYILHILRNDIIIIYGAHIIGYQFLIIFSRIIGKIIVFRSLLLGADDMDTLVQKKSGIMRKSTINLFRSIDLYFAINPVFAARFKDQIGKKNKILVCPQGVDVSFFMPLKENAITKIRNKKGIRDSCFIILSVGFMVNRKGFSGVFKVLQELDFEYKYFIAGEYEFGIDHFMYGNNQQAREIKQEGAEILGDQLCLTGPVENLQEFYQMADLVLINSLSEGLPNTLLEAMACGCPVLCRDLPGLRDYIVHHKEDGILFSTHHEMKDWVIRLRKDENFRRRLGKRATEKIKKIGTFHITWQKITEALDGK